MDQLKDWRQVMHGVALAATLIVSVIALLAFAEAWSQAKETRCFVSIAKSQFPKWLGCAMSAHEGLAGGLVGAAGALFAGWLAFASVQRQIDEQKVEKEKAQASSKLAATMALTQPMHAATLTFRSALRALAAEEHTQARQDELRLVQRGITFVKSTLDNFILRQVGSDLDAESLAAFIMIIATLSTMVDIHGSSAPHETDVDGVIHALTNVRTYLYTFDDDLAEKYRKDSTS
jgi:hypothetical protein